MLISLQRLPAAKSYKPNVLCFIFYHCIHDFYSKPTNNLNFHFRFSYFLISKLANQLIITLANHSLRKLSTGFAVAALMAWKLIVARATTAASNAAIKNTHHCIGTR
jgi:hypothetical protein